MKCMCIRCEYQFLFIYKKKVSFFFEIKCCVYFALRANYKSIIKDEYTLCMWRQNEDLPNLLRIHVEYSV